MDENAGRIRAFKNKGKDCSEMRRRRNDVTVELRKAKRDDQVLKRRNLNELETSPLKEVNSQQVIQILPLHTVYQNLQTGEDNTIFLSIQSVRKMLSKEKNPPVDDVIKAGLVPYLVKYLERFDFPLLQFEAAWALTNIASGNSDQTRTVVEQGALPLFVKLLSSPHMNVSEQAVWALGNIAGDGPMMRNAVISTDALGPLLALTAKPNSVQFLRNVTWTLSNLCRNKDPPPEISAVKMLLPTIVQLLHHDDKEVLADTCWALSYLTDGVNDRIQLVLDSGAVPQLVKLLGYPEVNVLTPALRAVGNIVTGRDDQTQAIIESNALFYFRNLLTHKRPSIVKEAAWAISNITAGTKLQIQCVIEAGLIPLVIGILKRAKGDFKAKKEAIWVITNYTSGANPDQLKYLLHCDVIPPMCEQMEFLDPKALLILLDGLNNIFHNASSIEEGAAEFVAEKFEESGGIDMLEKLQEHPRPEVYLASKALIEKYFSEGADDEDPNLQPDSTEGYHFAPPQSAPTAGFQFT